MTDGQFEPTYKVFIITVHPLTLQVINETEMILVQGQTSALMTNAVFTVVTNGNRSAIMYNVTIPPMFGQLFVDNSPVSYFSQESVENGKMLTNYLLENAFQCVAVCVDYYYFIIYFQTYRIKMLQKCYC